MQKKKVYNFTVIIEKDEDDYYVGYVPSIRGCHTQGRTIDELMKNIKEAIELCLEVEGKKIEREKFVGVQNIEVSL
jgi:predicted RNase H-like HicB family nuclease|tara:strand:- start:245 stop:472 length:228 start_codon:yes stop_codon:yes gene_type:complete